MPTKRRQRSRVVKGTPKVTSDKRARQAHLDALVRNEFGLDTPKIIRYHYGYNALDRRSGECRDEQAWMIELEYSDVHEQPANLQLATIRLRPRVSKREARKAVDLALTSFPEKSTGRRPGLRAQEQLLLKAVFTVCRPALDKPKQRKLIIQVARAALQQIGYTRSHSAVAKSLKQYLSEEGLPIKKYVTEGNSPTRLTS